MPRKLRAQFPAAIYHVMSRGDRREDILRDDFGHVFSRRYKALLVEGGGQGYLKRGCDYVDEAKATLTVEPD
jgi:hypothetical protein